MNDIIESMLSAYDLRNEEEKNSAVREIVQELILYSLSETDFFEKASFMGGTALRIFYGLRRYSEDLDFSLKERIDDFSFEEYLKKIKDSMSVFGITVDSRLDDKINRTTIDTSIIEAHSRELYLTFFPNDEHGNAIYDTQLTKIKVEIETEPVKGGISERRFRTLPYPFSVSLYSMPTLFSGKIHAILYRGWMNRVKGRDLYDFIFYINKGTKVNMEFLENKMRQSGYNGPKLDADILIRLLGERFDSIDYQSAISDVVRFIRPDEKNGLNVWCADFFKQISQVLW